MRTAISTFAQGDPVRHSRDPAILDSIGSDDGLPQDLKAAQKDWEKTDIVQWDFGDLPDTVQLTGAGGTQWTAFPALEKRDESIALVAFASRDEARRSHPQGVKALLLKKLRPEVKYLRKNLKLPKQCETMSGVCSGNQNRLSCFRCYHKAMLLFRRLSSSIGFQMGAKFVRIITVAKFP